MRYRILPYKKGSKSAKALAEELLGKVLRLEGSKFIKKPSDIVINWGNSSPCNEEFITFNKPSLTSWCSNKLNFFQRIKEQYPEIIPKFWTQKDDIQQDEYPVVCRTMLTGHSGAGIVIANTPNDLVDCSLYVKYIKKKDEYRVHLGKTGDETTTIVIQRKSRNASCETPNWQVRSHSNGFVFVRNNVNPPPCVVAVATQAFTATQLDFGAVDVIWNEQHQKAYVLEINTAPGLEGQTIKDYAEFFKGLNNA